MGVFRQLLFGKYLLITNTVSCGVMMAAGDVIQQRSEHWKKHCSAKYFPSSVMAASPEDEEEKAISSTSVYGHDYMRTRNMMVVGLLQGPFHHWFYTVLDKVFPGRNAKSVLKKTFLDQSIASPTCLTIFFIGLGILESRKVEEILKRTFTINDHLIACINLSSSLFICSAAFVWHLATARLYDLLTSQTSSQHHKHMINGYKHKQ